MNLSLIRFYNPNFQLQNPLSRKDLAFIAINSLNAISYYWSTLRTFASTVIYVDVKEDLAAGAEDFPVGRSKHGYIMPASSCGFNDLPLARYNDTSYGDGWFRVISNQTSCLTNPEEWVNRVLRKSDSPTVAPVGVWVIACLFLTVAIPAFALLSEEYKQYKKEANNKWYKNLYLNCGSKLLTMLAIQGPIDLFKGAQILSPGFYVHFIQPVDIGLIGIMITWAGILSINTVIGILCGGMMTMCRCRDDGKTYLDVIRDSIREGAFKFGLWAFQMMAIFTFVISLIGSLSEKVPFITFTLPDINKPKISYLLGDVTKAVGFFAAGASAAIEVVNDFCGADVGAVAYNA